MAFTKYQIFLVLLLIVTGSINSLTTKWADLSESLDSDGKVRHFQHPYVQTFVMFMGELYCIAIYKLILLYNQCTQKHSDDASNVGVMQSSKFNRFVLCIPALFDLLSTSTMYVGLTLTYVSSFQMLRGSVIIFVGLLSMKFLQRKLGKKKWLGIFFTILGLVVVGFSDAFFKSEDGSFNRTNIIIGDVLIILAQIMASIQMVTEEKFVVGLDIHPLQAVGWEGLFGGLILIVLLIAFYFTPVGSPFTNNPRGVLEDVPDALVQMGNNKLIIFATVGTFLSIGIFNFAGVSVTKEVSATTRMVMDSVRSLVIWVVSLSLKWQKFHWLQLLGFLILIFGNCLYNDIIC